MTQPVLYMIAGPNGAGKTTAAMKLLPDFLSIHAFVNADSIAHGLNPLNPEGQAFAAGRIMLGLMSDLVTAGKSFAFETTGSSRSFTKILTHAKDKGYRVGLIYLWLPNADLAKKRVLLRVRQGGHNIPNDVIERRYNRGLKNAIKLYAPLSDVAIVMNSADPDLDYYKAIAVTRNDTSWDVANFDLWQLIMEQMDD